jgi:hypothetical protein
MPQPSSADGYDASQYMTPHPLTHTSHTYQHIKPSSTDEHDLAHRRRTRRVSKTRHPTYHRTRPSLTNGHDFSSTDGHDLAHQLTRRFLKHTTYATDGSGPHSPMDTAFIHRRIRPRPPTDTALPQDTTPHPSTYITHYPPTYTIFTYRQTRPSPTDRHDIAQRQTRHLLNSCHPPTNGHDPRSPTDATSIHRQMRRFPKTRQSIHRRIWPSLTNGLDLAYRWTRPRPLTDTTPSPSTHTTRPPMHTTFTYQQTRPSPTYRLGASPIYNTPSTDAYNPRLPTLITLIYQHT